MTIEEIKDTLQTWIRTADDEYDREEMGRVCGLKESLHLIEKLELPPVTSQPKIGRWIDDGDCIICNKCNKSYCWLSIKQASNYCPNCGAKMKEINTDADSN